MKKSLIVLVALMFVALPFAVLSAESNPEIDKLNDTIIKQAEKIKEQNTIIEDQKDLIQKSETALIKLAELAQMMILNNSIRALHAQKLIDDGNVAKSKEMLTELLKDCKEALTKLEKIRKISEMLQYN